MDPDTSRGGSARHGGRNVRAQMIASPTTSLRRFFAYRFFAACLPYLPVATACFTARGLGMAEIMLLGTIYCVTVCALGIPFAALADRHGHRKAMLVGTLTLAFGAVLSASAHGFAAFAIAQLAFAIAGALDAGTDSAYLWSVLAAKHATYQQSRAAEARSSTVKLLGNVAGFAMGGVLAQLSPSAPFAVGAGFALIAAVLCAGLPDAPRSATPVHARELIASARTLLSLADLRRYVVLAALTIAMARIAMSMTGPFLASEGVSLRAVGLLSALGALAAAWAAHRAAPLADRFGEQRLLGVLPLVLFAAFIVMAVGGGFLAVAIALVPQILAGLYLPIWRSHLNAKIADSSRRATMLAIDGTLARVIFALLSGALALLAEGAGPHAALHATALLGAFVLLVIGLAPSRRRAPRMANSRLAWASAGAVTIALFASGTANLASANDATLPARTAKAATPAPAEVTAPAPSFLGQPDDELLAKLCKQPIRSLEMNPRGTTVKLKVVLEDGSKGSLRPDQTLDQGFFRADIAAYLLSRELGLGTVAPACQLSVTRAQLEAAADAKGLARLAAEVKWRADDTVPASVVLWVKGVASGNLDATIAQWKPTLLQKNPLATAALLESAREGSRLITWDFLIANWDRWSGGNTFRINKNGPFVWLDNAAGFGAYGKRARANNEAKLHKVERFSRSLIAAIRTATDDQLETALAPAGLSERAITQLLARRAVLLAHVDSLIATHGEPAVLAFD